jgi:hypothetical protein
MANTSHTIKNYGDIVAAMDACSTNVISANIDNRDTSITPQESLST